MRKAASSVTCRAMNRCLLKQLSILDTNGRRLNSRTFSTPAISSLPTFMSCRGGVYRFTLDLGGPISFSFLPKTPIGKVLESIKEEDTKTVASFTSSDGKPLADTLTLGEATKMQGGFKIQLGNVQLPVILTRSAGMVDPETEGSTELSSLLEKAQVIELRARLEQVSRRSIPFSQFEATCVECGIPVHEATTVAADLHRVGYLLHFAKDRELKGTVYLRPEEVLEDFFSRYGLHSPLRQFLLQRLEKLRVEETTVFSQTEPLLQLRASLDAAAASAAGRGMWLVSLGVAGGAASYWYLAYIHFSWDIMEPVTFFTGLGVSTIGYMWWMLTNEAYEYGNIYNYMVSRSKKKRYARSGLDLQKLAALEAQLTNIRTQIFAVDDKRLQLEVMGVRPTLARAPHPEPKTATALGHLAVSKMKKA